jgi:hypothetical protein
MRHPPRLCGIAAIALIAAALQGCGGGSGDSSTHTAVASTSAGSGTSQTATTQATQGLPVIVDPHGQVRGVQAVAGSTVPSPGCYSSSVPRRMTRTQFINALTDWAATLISDSGLPGRIQTMVLTQAQFPQDASINPDTARHQGYYRLDPTVADRQVSGIYSVAQSLASDLASTDARAATVLGNCTGTACMTAFIQKAGRVLFRRPMTSAEVAVYTGVAAGASDRNAVTKVLATMIASPQSYYLIEYGATGGDPNAACVSLTAQELASRLSLHLWDTIPDASLIADADSGALLQPAVYAKQVSRLLADPRADTAMRSFFRQWLRLDDLAPLDGSVGDPAFKTFAAGFQPLSTSTEAAIDEVLDAVSYVSAQNGSLQQVVTDRHSFARTADIASLVNTPVWSGSGTPPVFTEPSRVGLVTRVAFVATGSSSTTLPIQRGIKILGALTCQGLPPPAMNQTNAQADLSGVLTTRVRTERVTQMDGTTCVDCHKAVINPWGFVFEGFDALGRVRQNETVLDANGNVLGTLPINTAVTAGLGALASKPMSTAAQAQQYALDSGQIEGCFAKNYFRYAFGRADVPSDAQVIESVRVQAANGGNLKSLFASIVTRPEFMTLQRPQ